MGGGGGKAPAPKTFTPPPLDQSPATNPIPNFFAPAAQRPNPFAPFAQMPQAQAQNPFGAAPQMTPEQIELLLRRIRGLG